MKRFLIAIPLGMSLVSLPGVIASDQGPVRVVQIGDSTEHHTHHTTRKVVKKRSKKKSAAIIGGSAAGGAAIGALAGGGKGAAIGALVGGGSGAVYDRATHKKVIKE